MRWWFVWCLACAISWGCGGVSEPPSIPIADTNTVDSISFAGRQWTYEGPAGPDTDVRSWMRATCYTSDDANLRLIDQQWDQERHKAPVAIVRLLAMESRRNGKWVRHGPSAAWYRDGSRAESHNFDGDAHGLQRVWYPNGQLKIEREWRHDKMHGFARGWYPSGNPSYESQNINNQEVSGQSWPDVAKGEPKDPLDEASTRSQQAD